MKRILLAIALIACGFALGFYTASSQYTSREEIPPAEAQAKFARLAQLEQVQKKLGTLDFLRTELSATEAKYASAPTPELKTRIDDLKHGVESATVLAMISVRSTR